MEKDRGNEEENKWDFKFEEEERGESPKGNYYINISNHNSVIESDWYSVKLGDCQNEFIIKLHHLEAAPGRKEKDLRSNLLVKARRS